MGTCGEGNWSQIAWQFAGRIGKQCRERWHNQLRPNIKRDAWTNEEEERLIAAHRGLGNRCVIKPFQPAESTMLLPGRCIRLDARALPLVVVLKIIKLCQSESRVGTHAIKASGCVALWPSMCSQSGMPSQSWSGTLFAGLHLHSTARHHCSLLT